MSSNELFYGDNLKIIRNHIKDESIDLIYLDPPFNSKRNYNILFKNEKLTESTAQIKAFSDTWHWTEETEETFVYLIEQGEPKVSNMIGCFVNLLGRNQVTAYLVMMTVRLYELHRVLKPTGSLYLHCDPTSSHYLKLVLDSIFDVKNYRNEIVWHYRRWTGHAKHFLKMHDIILFYSKSNKYTFNPPYTSYTLKSLKRKKHYHTRIKGDEVFETSVNDKGVVDHDVWLIPVLNSQAKERLSYPTQKPVELIKKLILASSSEEDLILDPFCGCGTTIEAAEALNRQWIGIDITHIAISLIKYRLNKNFSEVCFKVTGEPETLEEAENLAKEDRFQFQIWACGLIKAKPFKKKGPDGGVDGLIEFVDRKTPKKMVISVKSGKVDVTHIRELASLINDKDTGL